jgi:hypothetical protein
VRYRGLHVPIALELVDGDDAPWLLESQDAAADAAETFLRDEKIQLRSRYKGVALGEEILRLADDLEEALQRPVNPIAQEKFRRGFTTWP